jgi:CRP-like cAMP-binding protein
VVETEQHARKNVILSAIPREEFHRLLRQMQTVEVEAKQVIYQAGQPVDHVYFPTTALMSMLMPTAEGETVELAMVGREGIVGVSALLNGARSREQGALAKVVTLIPGSAVQIKSDVLESAMEKSLHVSRCLRSYVGLLFTELSLSVSCNRLHSLEQRCARWLLTAMDKGVGMQEVLVTQEMLAAILGVVRQSVVQVLSDLEIKQVIKCGWGNIKIENSQRLSATACECYGILRKRLERMTAF